MKLIVGLGNPGSNYLKTRHNFGFLAIDYLKNDLGVASDWQASADFKSVLIETQIEKEKIILAKPQTMMNLSGLAAKALADYYKITPENIWVLHDDLDLPLGTIRISQGSGSAGHQGIQSLITNLGAKNFVRFRLGIHPVGQTFFLTFFKKLTSTKKFVLQKFSKSEEPMIKQIVKKTAAAIQLAIKEGLEKVKNQIN